MNTKISTLTRLFILSGGRIETLAFVYIYLSTYHFTPTSGTQHEARREALPGGFGELGRRLWRQGQVRVLHQSRQLLLLDDEEHENCLRV